MPGVRRHLCGCVCALACPRATFVALWVRGMYVCPLRGGLLSGTCAHPCTYNTYLLS